MINPTKFETRDVNRVSDREDSRPLNSAELDLVSGSDLGGIALDHAVELWQLRLANGWLYGTPWHK